MLWLLTATESVFISCNIIKCYIKARLSYRKDIFPGLCHQIRAVTISELLWPEEPMRTKLLR